jgi:large subunit ribosomal protein L53
MQKCLTSVFIGSTAEQSIKNIHFNSSNLSTLELLQLFNKHITTLAPKEEVVNVVKTKSEKRAGAAGGGGKRK